jgi:hypothetical protein
VTALDGDAVNEPPSGARGVMVGGGEKNPWWVPSNTSRFAPNVELPPSRTAISENASLFRRAAVTLTGSGPRNIVCGGSKPVDDRGSATNVESVPPPLSSARMSGR